MDVYAILKLILENPYSDKPYRDLAKYYESLNQTNESLAIQELIEKKIIKNEKNNDSNTSQEP